MPRAASATTAGTEMDLRLALDALRRKAPMIDARTLSGVLKRAVDVLRPLRAPLLQQARCRSMP